MFDSEFYAAERSVDEMTGEATFQEFSSSSTAPVAGREAESDANWLWKKGSGSNSNPMIQIFRSQTRAFTQSALLTSCVDYAVEPSQIRTPGGNSKPPLMRF